jgi:hypothetical protein
MTLIATTEDAGLMDRVAELFPEEYGAGLDEMDDGSGVPSGVPLGLYAERVADPSAEEEIDALFSGAGGASEFDPTDPGDPAGPLGHAGHAWLPESEYCAALWEEDGAAA